MLSCLARPLSDNYPHALAPFPYNGRMAAIMTPVMRVVLERLVQHEHRFLALLVAVRKGFKPGEYAKGDLGAAVKSALRSLEAAGKVVNADGVYSLR